MLATTLCLAASSAFVPLSSGVTTPHAVRAAGPLMAADRKFVSFDEQTIFEAREISEARKP